MKAPFVKRGRSCMPATTNPFDSNRGCVGNLSQETMAILAIGVTVLLSFIAGWGGLNSKNRR